MLQRPDKGSESFITGVSRTGPDIETVLGWGLFVGSLPTTLPFQSFAFC